MERLERSRPAGRRVRFGRSCSWRGGRNGAEPHLPGGCTPAGGTHVRRRKGRGHLANFENLPETKQVYELSVEERACPGWGVGRQEIGAEESTQPSISVPYLGPVFEELLKSARIARSTASILTPRRLNPSSGRSSSMIWSSVRSWPSELIHRIRPLIS